MEDFKYVLDTFVGGEQKVHLQIFTVLVDEMGTNNTPEGTEALQSIMSSIHLCLRIFLSLNYLDLPEVYEVCPRLRPTPSSDPIIGSGRPSCVESCIESWVESGHFAPAVSRQMMTHFHLLQDAMAEWFGRFQGFIVSARRTFRRRVSLSRRLCCPPAARRRLTMTGRPDRRRNFPARRLRRQPRVTPGLRSWRRCRRRSATTSRCT